MSNYILKDKTPVKCDNIIEWAKSFESMDRTVAKTTNGDITVSTVFLGIGYAYGGGKPLLFETMIFGGGHNEDQWRYSTWEEAEKGHKEACELAGA